MEVEMEMSKTYRYRKVMKPLLERKRRARINKCLDDLKEMIVEFMAVEGEYVTRLEKTDILELTVEHMKKMVKQKQLAKLESFRSGYIYAVDEVSKVLASTRGVSINLGTKLMTHLGHHLNQIQTLHAIDVKCTTINEKCTMRPLSVLVNDNCYKAAISPASSGYGSDQEIGDKGLLKAVEITKNEMWRPW